VPTSYRSRRAGAAIMFSRRQGVPRQGPEGLTWNAALETGGMLVSDKIKLVFDISAIRKG
ncbi:hypothetical protein ABZ753_18380, partial [Streptomyces griseoincarnatus]